MEEFSGFVNTSSLPVFFREKNRDREKTIFFIHGNSGSSRTWRNQFESAVFHEYRLVAFDLPGCGRSLVSNPQNWDYSALATGKILAEAVKQMAGSNPYCLTGFSYGSNVVGEMLNLDLSPVAITLTAACIIGEGYTLDKVFAADDAIFFHDNPELAAVELFFKETLLSGNKWDINILAEDFFLARPPFRTALMKSVVENKWSDEILPLQNMGYPIQVVFGMEDSLLQINYLDDPPFKLWEDKVHKIAGAGHYVQNDQPGIFQELLVNYLELRFSQA